MADNVVYERTHNDPYDGIGMGDTARDTITGFSGVVMGRCEYATGCNQVLLSPKAKPDGDWVESRWFDVERVEVVETGTVEVKKRPTGGMTPPPDRNGSA